ncbi:hypothetical protein LAZ67_7002164, partial [Cordylochernes scorpioides]
MEYKRCLSCIPGLGALTGYYQPGQLSPVCTFPVSCTMKQTNLLDVCVVQRHDPDRVGKLQPADRVATSSSAGIQDCRNLRLFVTDKNTGLRFLVDSGADISIIPPKDKNRIPSSDYKLYAANGTEIVTYGTKVRNLDIGLRRQFQWPFVIANTNRAIIGADFLNNFGLIIDIKNKRLIDGITNLSIRGVIQSISDMGNISTLNSSSKVSAILTKYPNLCRPPSDFVEAKHSVKHYIPTRGQPIHSKARRLDSQRLTLAKAEFQYMLNNGIIRPSNSPWASPLHLVSKKDESLRPCGDYRRLNAVTLPDRYPIPRLDDFHHILKGTRVYSKIDLCKAFYQIPIAEEDKPKTAIITPFGLFEFNVMSFGLRNATATFQRFMHEVLRNLDFAFVYLDDILVASKTEEEHYIHLETLFSRLNSYGLRINLSKSKFLVQEIDFLGYLITSHGVKPLPTKVKAILEYKKPKTVHELRIFLGMLNFYRTFLNNAAETQAILHEYLRGAKKKDRSEIKWTKEAEVQFEKCKQALANTALLAYPDTELPISLCTDASDRAVGSVLQQLDNNNWKPIAFFSKKLNPAQCIKATTKQLTSRFIWPNMNKDIREWAQACVNCQKCKVSIHTKSEIGKYQEVDERFSVVHIDLIGALPPSNGNIYCLTCIDRYTSWMEVVPLPDMKSETVARAFYENWIVRFGAPHTVISDQGKQFTSQLFKDLTTLCGIKLRHSTAYHPQCNGKIERLHRTIKTAIRAHNNIKWTETLPTVLLGLRAAINKDTNHSLSQMVYGKTIRLPGEFFDDSKHHLHAEEFVQQLQRQMELLKPLNEKHHSKTKVFVHKDLKTCSHVFIRTDRVKKPLEPPYEGPFPVLERTDKYFTLKVKGKNVTTSIDRLRPAYLLADSDNITAEHPTAARPIASGALPSTSSQQNPDPPDVEKYTEFQGTGSAPDLPRTRSGRIIKKPDQDIMELNQDPIGVKSDGPTETTTEGRQEVRETGETTAPLADAVNQLSALLTRVKISDGAESAIPPFDGTYNATQFFQAFDRKMEDASMGEQEKLLCLPNYLARQPLELFRKLRMADRSYFQVRQILLDLYPESSEASFAKYFAMKLTGQANLETYYREKTAMGLQLGLPQEVILETLTEGLPFNDQRLVHVVPPENLGEWFRLVQRIHGPSVPTTRPREDQPPPMSGPYHSTPRRPGAWNAPLPPSNCKFCGARHWHSECRRRPVPTTHEKVRTVQTVPKSPVPIPQQPTNCLFYMPSNNQTTTTSTYEPVQNAPTQRDNSHTKNIGDHTPLHNSHMTNPHNELDTHTNTQQNPLPHAYYNTTPNTHYTPQFTTLLQRYTHIFSQDKFNVPCLRIPPVKIPMNSEKIITIRPYRVPICDQQEIRNQIQQMLENGIIEQSFSPFSSPVTLVTKRDKTKRFCIDYRKVNELISSDVHPLPRIEDILDRLAQAKYFSTADISSAYWQVPIHPDSRPLLAFATFEGLYQPTRLPFGLKTSPQIYERAISQVLQRHGLDCVAHYFDDFIIYSNTLEEHQNHLRQFFAFCEAEKLQLNFVKCEFFKQSIDFLGYTITAGTITPLTRNTDIIHAIKQPHNRKTLQSFLGAVNVYNKFIPEYARLRAPLNNLLKKDVVWNWNEVCQKAFIDLKGNLTQHPILHLYKEGLPCQVYCDASTLGIAGILKQVHPDGNVYPVQYFSRTLRPHEKNYSISELECLAIVESVEKFRIYLMGRKFTIFSDHHALQWLKTIKNPSGRLFRWSLRLSSYEYEVRYIKGKLQYEADLLSRNPFCGFLDATLIKTHQPPPSKESSLTIDHNGLHTVSRKGVTKIILPKPLIQQLLQTVHTQYNHPGISQMSRIISTQYYWQGMSKDIKQKVKTCPTCQLTKRPLGPTYGELSQPPEAKEPFDLLSLDTIAGFAKYGNTKIYLHVVVDHLSRYAWTFPSKSTSIITYQQVLKRVLQDGSPKRLLTDRAPAFTSPKFRSFLLNRNIHPLLTTSNNPQANGLCERLNATLTGKLRLLHLENPKIAWTKLVKRVKIIYNKTPHSTTGFPPIYLMFGILPPELSDHSTPYPDIDKARKIAHTRTQNKHLQDKNIYDQRHKQPHFEVGDLVLVKLYHHPNTGKLAPYFTGPHTILEIISPNVVRIDRPNQPLQRDTDTIHVNKLKLYTEKIRYISPPAVSTYHIKHNPNYTFPFKHLTPELFPTESLRFKPTSSEPFRHLDPAIFATRLFASLFPDVKNCKPDNQLNHITPLPKDIKQENCEPTNHSNSTINKLQALTEKYEELLFENKSLKFNMKVLKVKMEHQAAQFRSSLEKESQVNQDLRHQLAQSYKDLNKLQNQIRDRNFQICCLTHHNRHLIKSQDKLRQAKSNQEVKETQVDFESRSVFKNLKRIPLPGHLPLEQWSQDVETDVGNGAAVTEPLDKKASNRIILPAFNKDFHLEEWEDTSDNLSSSYVGSPNSSSQSDQLLRRHSCCLDTTPSNSSLESEFSHPKYPICDM